MEVRIYPNPRRPGVGLKPRREAQRPLLPQHARHCPVLEAGSALGYLVYPPLEANESFHVGYDGEGQYRFIYYLMNPNDGKWQTIFTIAISLPSGGFGVGKEEVTFEPGMPTTPREVALHLMRRFINVDDLGTPAGAITLRGAWNFQTPTGWDTVYTPIFNSIERPVVPMMIVRVETDWFFQETEFRYVLQPGEGMSVERSLPIGQAMFVPREPITLRDATEEEVAAIHKAQSEFWKEKPAHRTTTPYGMPYSPHYLRTSRAQAQGGQAMKDPAPAGAPREIGRNDPCPCGSGKKYRKCHGEG